MLTKVCSGRSGVSQEKLPEGDRTWLGFEGGVAFAFDPWCSERRVPEGPLADLRNALDEPR